MAAALICKWLQLTTLPCFGTYYTCSCMSMGCNMCLSTNFTCTCRFWTRQTPSNTPSNMDFAVQFVQGLSRSRSAMPKAISIRTSKSVITFHALPRLWKHHYRDARSPRLTNITFDEIQCLKRITRMQALKCPETNWNRHFNAIIWWNSTRWNS